MLLTSHGTSWPVRIGLFILGSAPIVIRFVTGRPMFDAVSTRREWLRIGGLAGLYGVTVSGRSVAASRPSRESRSPGFGRAKSVIVIYANGGQSQLETWDPKPDAPTEIRGEFRAIPSAVPGTFV